MEERKHCTLVLQVADVGTAQFDPLMERLATQGITFVTLAEEQATQPDWLTRFCDLDNETRKGDIGTPRTVEEMPERLAFLGVVPEALFLAKCGEQYVGYTLLNNEDGSTSCLRQGWTGVRPEYRQQGIATALKVIGITYAKKHGYQQMVTEPRVANIASIGMSTKVGFRLAME